MVQAHNQREDTTSKMEINQFADMSMDEMPLMKNLPKVDETDESNEHPRLSVPPNTDWRTQGKVTTPLNQMYCGVCWAFSAVSAMESALAIK